jgi:fructosamine-3-kinase
MKLLQTNLLNLRENLGNYFDNLQGGAIQVTKRGKQIGLVIDSELGEEFLRWKEKQDLLSLFNKNRVRFESYGDKFLQAKNLDKGDIDKLAEAVSDD